MTRYFAIVPAAGRSERMGRPKLLLPWRGRTLMEHVIDRWQASRVDRITVVCHPEHVRVHEVCRRAAAHGKLNLVIAEAPPPGMRSSVALGLAAIAREESPASDDAWLLAPADIPGLATAIIDRLIAAHEASGGEILVPACQGKRGHPVLFPWPLAAEVEQLPSDRGVNELLNRHAPRRIECGLAALAPDIDTPADYEHLQGPPSRRAEESGEA